VRVVEVGRVGWVGEVGRLVHYSTCLTGKYPANYEKFARKLDLNGKHVANSASFVQIE
jgi:hypothetical protein